MRRELTRGLVVVVAGLILLALPCPAAWAQFGFGGGFGGGIGGGGGGGGFGGGGFGGGGNAGNGNGFPGGIAIDADGVITSTFSVSRASALAKKRMEAVAVEHLPSDLNQVSPMRKVSLVRLEAACEAYANEKKVAPLEIQFLAGLQRIDYIFVAPDGKDLILAGPAEGFAPDKSGCVLGIQSGRPPLRIDDLIVALRTSEDHGGIGCSIDPIPDNLVQLKRYLASHSSATSVSAIQRRFQQMARILGMQDVSIWGVPTDSHFGQVLVEADYRMKRISMGLENPGVRGLRSHLSMITPQGNTMQRWWLTPLYDAFYKSEDGLAFQIEGQRAQLLAQEELATSSGDRFSAPFTRASTQAFAQQFTDRFPDLAENEPVFAELQNLIDLAIVSALFRKERLPEQVGWSMSLFLNPERAVVASGTTPRKVPSQYNTRRAGGVILGLVSGGVNISARQTVAQVEFKTDPSRRLEGLRRSVTEQQRPESHPWWWD